MVPVLHAGIPHRVSLRGLARAHPQLVCFLMREMGSEARASLSSPRSLASAQSFERTPSARAGAFERGYARVAKPIARVEGVRGLEGVLARCSLVE